MKPKNKDLNGSAAAAFPLKAGETGYEGESNTGFVCNPCWIRHQMYWALL